MHYSGKKLIELFNDSGTEKFLTDRLKKWHIQQDRCDYLHVEGFINEWKKPTFTHLYSPNFHARDKDF